MLECRACLWRCLRAICPEISPNPLIKLTRPFPRSRPHRTVRLSPRYASSLSIRGGENAVKPENSIIKAVKSRPAGAVKLPEGLTSAQFRRLKLEVPWLGDDRVKVLRRTKELLKEQRQAEALELVKLSSKEQPCTIAWNAILDDLLERKKVNEAFKVYNDMKKRAQIPDSYTYSTLFNGLTANSKTPNVGRRATALWQALNNPNSKVKPSILLTNAALKACASANDIDAVWTIAGAIPESGAEAANNITYTTILNAMRFNATIEIGDAASHEQQIALNIVVAQGRQIWADVISRWISARLTLDEDLVCAMGRLLLAGLQPQDWDDVFALCAQTMNIPREAPPLEVRDRSHNPNKVNQIPPPFGQSDRTITTATADVSAATGQEFRSVPNKKKGIWVKATNQTLTLLMETCQKMFLSKASRNYWKLLTDPGRGFSIKPDSPSFHAYLRMLRQSRASSESVRFVRDEMKDQPGAGKTFRIAMSTCVRNQFSPNAMREATELMDIMLMRMRCIDAKTGIMYMKLALGSPHTQDTLVALGYMTPQRTKLWDMVQDNSSREKEAFLELARLVVSGFDRVITTRAVPQQRGKEDYQKRKATWTYAVQRMMGGGERVRSTLSNEEVTLLAKKKVLQRFERKKERDGARSRRTRSRAVIMPAQKGDGLPVLETDVV